MRPPSRAIALTLIALAVIATAWCLIATPVWLSSVVVIGEACGWSWWLEQYPLHV